jgi:beta-glucosidase
MGSYNQFRGQYCCHNDLLLNKILKRLDFDGVVITDWGGTRYKASRSNGLDIEMGTGTDGLITSKKCLRLVLLANPFLKLLKSGEIEEDVLNDKVREFYD